MPVNILSDQHSEEVQEIIGAVPNWLIRWGITLFFAVLFLILFLSAFIKVPDIVPAKLRIDATSRPLEIISRQDGKLIKLLVKENQVVKAGTILGYLESNARHEEVLALSQLIDSLQAQILQGKYNFTTSRHFDYKNHYGELQPAMQEFYLAYLKFLNYTPEGIYVKRRQVIKDELVFLKQLETQLTEQQKINQKELLIAEHEFEINKTLANSNVISRHEFRQQESKLLTNKLPLHATKSSLITNSIAQSVKVKELMEMEHEVAEQHATFLTNIQRFKSEIDKWKKNYILLTERNGKVMLHQILKENQWIKANRPVMYIADEQAGTEPFGELILGQHAFGKIKKGQDVLIRLNAYPAQEYGLLKGRISYISDIISGDTTYTAMVQLPKKTNYGKTVNLRIGLIARAEVITEERSLLVKVFSSLKDVLVNT